MNSKLPISIDVWQTDFDPYGMLENVDWLARAEKVEDILQLSHSKEANRVIDLGYYQDRYTAYVIENSNWEEPVETFKSYEIDAMTEWLYSAISRYA